jgi:hypothetical protein
MGGAKLKLRKIIIAKNYKVEEFTHKDLKKWEVLALGTIEGNHGQTVMHETKGSLGYMLVSS